VNTADAKSSVHDGTVYYFCSADCRDKFEAEPPSYTGGKALLSAGAMEHSDG
jgi:YHS domain-containing protein